MRYALLFSSFLLLVPSLYADSQTFVHISCSPYAARGVISVNATAYENGAPYPCVNDLPLMVIAPDGTITPSPTVQACGEANGKREYSFITASQPGTYTLRITSPFDGRVETCQSTRVYWAPAAKVPDVPAAWAVLVAIAACAWATRRGIKRK